MLRSSLCCSSSSLWEVRGPNIYNGGQGRGGREGEGERGGGLVVSICSCLAGGLLLSQRAAQDAWLQAFRAKVAATHRENYGRRPRSDVILGLAAAQAWVSLVFIRYRYDGCEGMGGKREGRQGSGAWGWVGIAFYVSGTATINVGA